MNLLLPYLSYDSSHDKEIEAQMKQAHAEVIEFSSYHDRDPAVASGQTRSLGDDGQGEWLSALAIGTTFLVKNHSYTEETIDEYTLIGKYWKEGVVVAAHLRDNRLSGNADISSHSWYDPKLFCKNRYLIGYL